LAAKAKTLFHEHVIEAEMHWIQRLVKLVCPLYGCTVRLHRAVLPFEVLHDICDLDAAARFERAKGGA
jgi:hypothetical protein